jgi:hypothetical protein
LFKNKIFYIDCRRTNGIAMLKVADHESMSGEPIGTTHGMIFASGKLVIWPSTSPENQGFRKLRKFPREKT